MIITSFSNLINSKLELLLKLADELNLGLRFIGGVSRDYILFGKLSRDIDIEVYFEKSLDFNAAWESLINKLSSQFQIEKKPFNILTFKLNDYEIELTPIRTEVFNDKRDHKNFTAIFHTNLDAEIAFKRRDFTFNAIAFEYHKKAWKINDPFGGVEDLNKNIMKICDIQYFKLDPVRFLRAYRFRSAFNLEFDSILEAQLKLVDLSDLSLKNFIYEFKKSQDFKFFLNHCLSNINFMHWFRELGFLSAKEKYFNNINKYAQKIKDLDRPVEFILILCFNCDLDKVTEKLQLNGPTAKSLSSFDVSVQNISQNIQSVFNADSFDELVKSAEFLLMFESLSIFSKNNWLVELIDDLALKNFIQGYAKFNFSFESLKCDVNDRKYLKLYKYIMDQT